MVRYTVLLAGLVLAGCGQKVSPAYTAASGSLALSKDDALLYAVDSDNDLLVVIDTETEAPIASIQVGRAPERVVVAPDERIFVSNRGSRSVSVVKRGIWAEAAQIPVGVEPIGLAVSLDSKFLYVVNSTSLENPDVGTLTAVDLETLAPAWELPVGREPRGISLLEDGRAVITLFKDGDLVTVDLAARRVVQNGTQLHQRINTVAAGTTTTSTSGGEFGGAVFFAPKRFAPRGFNDVALSPRGDRLFGPAQFDREDPIDRGGEGDSYGGDSCTGTGSVASPAVVAFDFTAEGINSDIDDDNPDSCGGGGGGPIGGGGDPIDPGGMDAGSGGGSGGDVDAGSGGGSGGDVDGGTGGGDTGGGELDAGSGGGGDGDGDDDDDDDHPHTVMAVPFGGMPLQGATASVVDPTGTWLYVVNRSTDNVAIMPAYRKNGPDLIPGSSLREVVTVGKGANGLALTRDGRKAYVYNAFDHTVSRLTRGSSGQVEETLTIKVADDVLAPDVVAGRKLFFDATDPRMTASNIGIACATCHLDGRDDGHVWSLSGGKRQTMSLAGRHVGTTAPYHWDGEFSSVQSFVHDTVQLRMGGEGVDDEMARQVFTFIDSQAPADNAQRGRQDDAVTRGAALFASAGCSGCHAGADLTNNTFADVGTFVVSGENPDDPGRFPGGLNVPTLLGISRSAPYLHDGSAPTLRSLLLRNLGTNRHGDLTGVTSAQIDDLTAYLKTL